MYHGSRAVVVVMGPEFIPIDLRMACEGGELAILSWCSHSVNKSSAPQDRNTTQLLLSTAHA